MIQIHIIVQVGIVQTAYANGASTAFIRNTLGLEVAITPTGVKFLHEEAVKFDIGIYFEANGHGTVLFSTELLQRLDQVCLCVSSCVFGVPWGVCYSFCCVSSRVSCASICFKSGSCAVIWRFTLTFHTDVFSVGLKCGRLL